MFSAGVHICWFTWFHCILLCFHLASVQKFTTHLRTLYRDLPLTTLFVYMRSAKVHKHHYTEFCWTLLPYRLSFIAFINVLLFACIYMLPAENYVYKRYSYIVLYEWYGPSIQGCCSVYGVLCIIIAPYCHETRQFPSQLNGHLVIIMRI